MLEGLRFARGCARTLAAALPLAWAVTVTPVHALQEADTVRLTLDEALRLAEGSNPAFRRAVNATELNSVQTRSTWLSEIVPRVDLSLFNTGFTGNRQRLGTDNLGNPIQNPSAEWVYFSNTSQALNVTWELQGRSLFDAHRRQRLLNLEREIGQAEALGTLQIEVRRGYRDAQEQLDLRAAEAELIEARGVDLNVAERLYGLAMRTRVDVLNAELALEQQALALQRQEAAYRRALLSLATSLGLEGPSELALADEALPVFDPAVLDTESLVRRALAGNPSISSSEIAVRRADLALSEQRNGWWPRLSVGFDVFRRTQLRNGEALFDVSFDESLDSRFFLQFSLPLFDGFFDRRLEAAQASVDLRNRRQADREERLQVEEAVRGARLELDNEWASLRLAERSHAIAEEALRLAREEYRLGTRSFEDLRASFDQEAETRRQVITARYAFVDALLDLEEAVGGVVRPAAGTASGGGGH